VPGGFGSSDRTSMPVTDMFLELPESMRSDLPNRISTGSLTDLRGAGVGVVILLWPPPA
jgi:hypothetical protein